MTALDVPGFGAFEGGRSASLRGRWTLIPGGTAETRPRRGPVAAAAALAPWRRRSVTMPLLSGALVVNEPVHLTVGEISVAVDKTRSVRLTLAEVTALGNRRYTVDVIASALGPDAGPDETIRLEGTAARVRDGALRITLAGLAPSVLIPGPVSRGSSSRGSSSRSSRSSVFSGPLFPGALLHGSLLHGSLLPGSAVSSTPGVRGADTAGAADAVDAVGTSGAVDVAGALVDVAGALDAGVLGAGAFGAGALGAGALGAMATGALIVSPTRGAGFRLKLIATFAH